MHDVIRDFLREELGSTRLAQLHQVLVDAAAVGLPTAAAAAAGGGTVTAWWELPEAARYLREHLIEHLLAAGRVAQAEEVAADLRWAGARLQASGPAGPYADLALIGTPRAKRLSRVLGQAAHLLAPTNPPHSLIDILYSRVSHDPDWGAQAEALTADRKLPRLINKWPLADLPAPALRRAILTGHVGLLTEVAIAPDGTWLASGGEDGTVRIWDPATGQQRAALTGHDGAVRAVAIAPDGTWLASAGEDGTVRIWDPATGRQQAAVLTGPDGAVRAVAIAPDGNWLASGGDDGQVRIWDPATGRQRSRPRRPRPGARLTRDRPGVQFAIAGHDGVVSAVAIAPDGTWLASASYDGTVRIWDPATGQLRGQPHRPPRRGEGGGDRPGWHLAGQRRPRDGADLGPGHRPAKGRPHRPRRPGDRGGDRPGRHLAGQPRRGRARCGSGTRPPASYAVSLTGHDGRGDGGGDRPGRDLAGQRQRGRDGADLGPGHRPAKGQPSPATPSR